MKKYLIVGILALSFSTLIISCSNNEGDYTSVAEAKIQSFDENFRATFGTIATGHDWGFGTAEAARTRSAQPDGNMWGPSSEPNRSTQPYEVPAPLTQAQKDKVRDWFQTHRKPTGVSVTYTDFFVQQVYKGADRPTEACPEVYTAKDGTTSVTGSNQMDYLFAGRGMDHINNFNWGKYGDANKNPLLMTVWNGTMDPNQGSDFNDQKVYYTDEIMLMRNSSTDCFGYHESYVSKDYFDRYVIIPGDIIDRDITSGPSVAGMYFVGFDFDADDTSKALSQQVDRDYYFSDWIVRITKGKIPSGGGTDGGGTSGGGSSSSTTTYRYNETVEYRKRTTVAQQGRIICEDLGATTDSENNRRDIDYNDVVFDAYLISEVYYTKYIKTVSTYIDGIYQGTNDNGSYEQATSTNNYTKIILQAAGGTIPLSVAGQEVHDKFGVSVDVMVNTVNEGQEIIGSAVSGRPPVEFTVNTLYSSLRDIPVVVRWSNDVIYLTAHEGMSPQKICVPINTPWCKERSSIDYGYPKFADWVHSNGTEPWYNRVQDKLYDRVPTSLEMPSYNDEVISSNSSSSQQSSTTYTVNPASNEKIVWSDLSGNTAFGSSWNNTNYKVSYSTLNQNDSNGKGFGVNSIIRVYVSTSNGYNIQLYSEDGSYNWVKLVEASAGNNDSHISNNNGYVEYTVTSTALEALQTGNLALVGVNCKVLAVTIDNTNSTASSTPSTPTTYPSGTVVNLFTGSKSRHYNWGDEQITADKSIFARAKVGDVIRVRCETYCESGQTPTGEWRLYPGVSRYGWTKLEPSPWYGDSDGYIRNGQNPSHYNASTGYITFSLSQTSMDLLADYDFLIAFSGLTVTQVDLIAQ